MDLSAYDSNQSAADVAALREALGYDEWSLYGVSYGTRLALTVMGDHPEGIKSVILDSVYPVHIDAPEEQPSDTVHSLELLFDGCAADPDCGAVYRDLEVVLYGTVERLNNEPETMTASDPDNGDPYALELTGDDFVFEFDGVGHGVMDAGACPESVITAFLDGAAHPWRSPGWTDACVRTYSAA